MLPVVEILAHLYILAIFTTRIIYAEVFVLTDANFTDNIRNYEMTLVKFYVPW